MNRIFIFILSVLLCSGFSEVKVKEQHLYCEEDQECEIIGTGGCCRKDIAVNKKYSRHYSKPPELRCRMIKMYCPRVRGACVENQCQMVKLQEPE